MMEPNKVNVNEINYGRWNEWNRPWIEGNKMKHDQVWTEENEMKHGQWSW